MIDIMHVSKCTKFAYTLANAVFFKILIVSGIGPGRMLDIAYIAIYVEQDATHSKKTDGFIFDLMSHSFKF